VGDTLHLRTVSGWFEVKTARVEKTADGTLLGLDRGREVARLTRPTQRVPWIGVVSAIGLGLLAMPAFSLWLANSQSGKTAAVVASPPPVERPESQRPDEPAPPRRRTP
jgi:hypothetical protein